MDGVLVEAKEIHYESLNKAIDYEAGNKYIITESEHLSMYDGLKTTKKLEMLTNQKGLNPDTYDKIWKRKQELTIKALSKLKPNQTLQSIFHTVADSGYKIAVCSNSIRKTISIVLDKLGIAEFVNLVISNEDVKNSKPHPEMYWKAMSQLGVLPEETLIIEDSPHGLRAAYNSNAHVLRVKNPQELNYDKLQLKLSEIKNGKDPIIPKWKDEKLNILVPMAGAGSRFQQAGYTFPKPLIDVKGKPMIQVVVDNLNIDANYIYVVQKAHREKYNLNTLLNIITPNCKIVEVDGLTEGAACTALLAEEFINNNNPLFFANSDQFVQWDSNEFLYKMNETKADGGIVTFKAIHPKWSFVKVDQSGCVTEVAEKNPISDNATVGFYYWKHGSDFIKYAKKMIELNKRVNNEFYVCPVFNEAIEDNKIIRTFQVNGMWGLGTPEDLNYYLKNYK